MRKLVFVLLVGCSSPEHKLPTATFTPHLTSQAASVACGADVAYNGNSTWDLRYAYLYDSDGRLASGTGTWANAAAVDTFAYTYAGDDFSSYVYTSGWDNSQETVNAAYDAANNMVSYTWSYANDPWTYTYSSFIGANQPAREDVSHASDPAFGYDLAYDSNNRLVSAVPTTGPTWTWTYDDAALTITADAGNGDVHGVYTYDANDLPLSEVWTGTDPQMVDSSTTYSWDADTLLSVASTYGTDSEISTMRYDCSAARRATGQTTHVIKPRHF